MSAIRQLAQAIDTVANCTKELSEAIYARFERESNRITKLEEEIERLKREPRMSLARKLKERGL